LPDAGHYNTEHGVSAATLFELYRPGLLACHLDFYLARVAEMSQWRRALQRGTDCSLPRAYRFCAGRLGVWLGIPKAVVLVALALAARAIEGDGSGCLDAIPQSGKPRLLLANYLNRGNAT